MCNYLPLGVRDDDPTAPWNREDKPEPESFGSDCCGAPVKTFKGQGTCMKCGCSCEEVLETDEEMYARIQAERDFLAA